MLKASLWVLWPSFLAACLGEMLFFAMFDPEELVMSWQTPQPSRIAVYSVGFFFFWFLATLSGAMTFLLGRSSDEVNR